MKEKLLKLLHFLKIDVLLLWVLERLSSALTKKHLQFKTAIACRFECHVCAEVIEESNAEEQVAKND